MWLDADTLVREALRDFDAGWSGSIPSIQYKVLTTLARCTTTRLQARLQSLGRR
jgi:hypothetical protein